MNFVEALKEAKKQKCGLRSVKWTKNLSYLALMPKGRWLFICARGSLRISKGQTSYPINLSLSEYLSEWVLVSESDVNKAWDEHWAKFKTTVVSPKP